MRLLYIASVLTAVLPVFAQKILIASPASGDVLTIGKPFTVKVNKNVTQGATQSVSAVFGLQRCGANPCPTMDNDELFGMILYQGDFTPVRHASQPFEPPYQNFTFNLAASEKPQNAVIHIAHLYLNGGGPEVLLQKTNVSVRLA